MNVTILTYFLLQMRKKLAKLEMAINGHKSPPRQIHAFPRSRLRDSQTNNFRAGKKSTNSVSTIDEKDKIIT